ncbi:hypothetical protein CkaCkLH20_12241 [Colletotrichum karsti]|uniref:Ubiquitin-like protease family profile domain-containing protein n=1 Tax=Colletotrichum karsti TaxID=1095194 RepID=A0A9P6HUU7_9PEZI|nr:uncharacterized protein CkaCkLH20_12241 [Colletotrichum karsti]KAF9870277.1 hypothetical protein CkaCkLH20_12241 [Colletotrichum karsti]
MSAEMPAQCLRRTLNRLNGVGYSESVTRPWSQLKTSFRNAYPGLGVDENDDRGPGTHVDTDGDKGNHRHQTAGRSTNSDNGKDTDGQDDDPAHRTPPPPSSFRAWALANVHRQVLCLAVAEDFKTHLAMSTKDKRINRLIHPDAWTDVIQPTDGISDPQPGSPPSSLTTIEVLSASPGNDVAKSKANARPSSMNANVYPAPSNAEAPQPGLIDDSAKPIGPAAPRSGVVSQGSFPTQPPIDPPLQGSFCGAEVAGFNPNNHYVNSNRERDPDSVSQHTDSRDFDLPETRQDAESEVRCLVESPAVSRVFNSSEHHDMESTHCTRLAESDEARNLPSECCSGNDRVMEGSAGENLRTKTTQPRYVDSKPYMNLKRSQEACDAEKEAGKNVGFISSLVASEDPHTWTEKKITRLSRQVQEKALILFPVHEDMNHWVLYTWFDEKKVLRRYDSLRSNLSRTALDIKSKTVVDIICVLRHLSPGDVEIVEESCLQQQNNYDCGLYALHSAHDVAGEKDWAAPSPDSALHRVWIGHVADVWKLQHRDRREATLAFLADNIYKLHTQHTQCLRRTVKSAEEYAQLQEQRERLDKIKQAAALVSAQYHPSLRGLFTSSGAVAMDGFASSAKVAMRVINDVRLTELELQDHNRRVGLGYRRCVVLIIVLRKAVSRFRKQEASP